MCVCVCLRACVPSAFKEKTVKLPHFPGQNYELREITGPGAQTVELVESRGPSIRVPTGLLPDSITFTV